MPGVTCVAWHSFVSVNKTSVLQKASGELLDIFQAKSIFVEAPTSSEVFHPTREMSVHKCTLSVCLQVIHWGYSTSVLADSETSSLFSLPLLSVPVLGEQVESHYLQTDSSVSFAQGVTLPVSPGRYTDQHILPPVAMSWTAVGLNRDDSEDTVWLSAISKTQELHMFMLLQPVNLVLQM